VAINVSRMLDECASHLARRDQLPQQRLQDGASIFWKVVTATPWPVPVESRIAAMVLNLVEAGIIPAVGRRNIEPRLAQRLVEELRLLVRDFRDAAGEGPSSLARRASRSGGFAPVG
jgi:hypothetical protein